MCRFIVLQESGGICLAFIIVKCVVSKTSFTPFANLYFRIPRLWLLFRSSLFVAQSVRCLVSAEIQCQRCKQCPLVRYQKDISLCCCWDHWSQTSPCFLFICCTSEFSESVCCWSEIQCCSKCLMALFGRDPISKLQTVPTLDIRKCSSYEGCFFFWCSDHPQ